MTDKDILYSILRRDLYNITRQFPLVSQFNDVLSNKLISLIDPYVEAFLEEPGKTLDEEQLGDFVQEEMSNKISEFKEKYRERKLKEKELE